MELSSAYAAVAGFVRYAAGKVGVDLYQFLDDRRALEQRILPYFAAREECRRTLFVGCSWYTRRYERIFEGKEFWTLECDPSQARHGASRHVIDGLENVGRHFQPGSLDLIVCNGLLGWGLNSPVEIERTFSACVTALRVGGAFLLGWDDNALRRPCRPEEIVALRSLQPARFGPFDGPRYISHGAARHTYDLYEKRLSAERRVAA